MVTDVETSTPLEPPQQLTPIDAKQSSASSKKKKKRRNGMSASNSDNSSGSSSPAPPEPHDDTLNAHSSAADLERWKHRVQSLRSMLSKAQAENRVLSTDLKAAIARANDAEQAESAVNKGLLTARSVISQRDRSIAELNAVVSNQRAELQRLEEEKKKLDRRVTLLKTVSANLQEAREERDAAERKLDESQSSASRLRKRIVHLQQVIAGHEKQLEVLELKEKQLDKLECQLHDLRDEKQLEAQQAVRRSRVAAGVGALGGAFAALSLCVLARGREDEAEASR